MSSPGSSAATPARAFRHLPVAAGSRRSVGAADQGQGPQRQPLIWILDDDERLCELLSQRLGELGWLVHCFHEGRSFDQSLELGQPDLLVLDVMLPGRSGSDLLAGLRQRGHGLPVLMLSALRSPLDRIAGLEAGADDYLGKPFEFRELQLRIERLLDFHTRLMGIAAEPARFQLASLEFSALTAELRSPGGEVNRISRGDAALLQALCRRPGEVIGRQVLARASGSLVDARQSRSIDVRMSRLRRLLQGLLPDQGEVIEACRGIGYRMLVPVTPLLDS